MAKIEVDESALCSFTKLGPTLIPKPLTAQESLELCHKINGEMFVISDQAAYNKATQLKGGQGYFCPGGMYFESHIR